MHIVERLSTLLRLSPEKPEFLYEFVPLGVEKYITVYNDSLVDSHYYPYFQDVISDLSKFLQKNGIRIVQILNNRQNDKKLAGCIYFSNFSYPQLNYVLKKSLLHVATDPYTCEVCGALQTPSISLTGVRVTESALPYFRTEKNVCISSVGSKISSIKSESISNKILEILGFEMDVPYQTTWIGEKYPTKSFQYIPNFQLDDKRLENENIEIRLDLKSDLNFAAYAAQRYSHTLTSKTPLPKDFLLHCKKNNKGIKFLVEKGRSPDAFQLALENGFKVLFSIENNPDVKLAFLGHNLYLPKTIERPEVVRGTEFIRSSKLFLSNGKSFFSEAHLEKGIPASITNKVIDSPSFWKDSDYFKLIEQIKE